MARISTTRCWRWHYISEPSDPSNLSDLFTVCTYIYIFTHTYIYIQCIYSVYIYICAQTHTHIYIYIHDIIYIIIHCTLQCAYIDIHVFFHFILLFILFIYLFTRRGATISSQNQSAFRRSLYKVMCKSYGWRFLYVLRRIVHVSICGRILSGWIQNKTSVVADAHVSKICRNWRVCAVDSSFISLVILVWQFTYFISPCSCRRLLYSYQNGYVL